ncbi:MAG: hypothetical protein M0Q88_00500 [Bacilli bacterium]|nr:hypothetical protein [Bacilli bacterium]
MNYGTYHLSDNPALYEPSRNNAFEFVVNSRINTLVQAGVTLPDDTTMLTGIQDVIKLSVSEASVPHFDLGVIEIKRGNSTMKFAGTPTFNEYSIKCNDYVGAKTKAILLAWQALAYDVAKDVVNLAVNYKFDCQLVEYTPDYSRIIRTWTLKNCWVRALSEGSFTHDSNDKRTVDVTIIYDRAIPEETVVRTQE